MTIFRIGQVMPNEKPASTGQRATAAATKSRNPDPVGEGMFRIQIGSQTIGHFSEIDGLTVEYEVFEWQEGGENRFVHKLRGRAKYPNIVLKRGITHEAALLDWFRKCQTKTDRQEGHIDLLGRDGKPVRRFAFEGAFPVKWTGPKLNAASTSIATEQLEIAHTGWRPENAGG